MISRVFACLDENTATVLKQEEIEPGMNEKLS
jgi:hypothetical protein